MLTAPVPQERRIVDHRVKINPRPLLKRIRRLLRWPAYSTKQTPLIFDRTSSPRNRRKVGAAARAPSRAAGCRSGGILKPLAGFDVPSSQTASSASNVPTIRMGILHLHLSAGRRPAGSRPPAQRWDARQVKFVATAAMETNLHCETVRLWRATAHSTQGDDGSCGDPFLRNRDPTPPWG